MKYNLLAAAVLFSGVLLAEGDEFAAAMKSTKSAMDTLAQPANRTGQKAMSAAERIGSIYEEMIGFWRQRNAADAVKISEQGKAAAASLASAAFSKDEARAAEAFSVLQGTCKSCHDARREKTPEGKYRIK